MNKENIVYSVRNLVLKPSRSLLTLLSIFIGITTIFIFISFGWGLYAYVDSFATGSSADKIIIEGRGGFAGNSPVTFTDDDVEFIERSRGIVEATGMYFKPVEIEQKDVRKFVFAIGIKEDDLHIAEETFSIDLIEGRSFTDGSLDIILGYNFLVENKIFERPFSINDRIEINGIKLRVAGFYSEVGNPSDDSNIYVSAETMQKLFPSEDLGYSWILARGEIDTIDLAVENVRKDFRKERNEEQGKETFSVTSFVEQLESFASALNVVIAFIILIAFISVVVSAINTANTMVTSVLERVQEIGVLKSIGAKNSDIFNIFLLESSILGFVAGVIGVVLGWLISSGVSSWLASAGWGFLEAKFDIFLFLGLIAFATIVGAISGVIPAIDASKKKPVDALRYE